jgi:hypothetical protein
MAHARKPDFVFRWNGRVHLNGQGRQFSRQLTAVVCASAVVMLDTPCSEVVWRVLATHSIRQFPLHLPSLASPCAIKFQLDSTSGKVPLKSNLELYYSWQYIHIDAIHAGTGGEGVVGAIPNINYKNEKYSMYSHSLRPLVTYMQDINDTCLLWGTFSCICEMQSSHSVFGVERRDRASDILTRLRETEPFVGNEQWELFKTQITPCLCNTKTQTVAENGTNLSTFVTVKRGRGILLRLRERSYLKGYHMACFPECSIPVQIRYLAGVGHK